MTLREWLTDATHRLAQAGVDSPRLEAHVLAAHVLQVDRSWLLAHPEHDFNDLAGETLLQRRERREPLAYIVGFREFYGRHFRVTPAVLIPRQDTEVLVETALNSSAKTVLDIGTGSGAIAITLKMERPEWCVTATDISEQALEVAEGNASDLGADIRWVRSDGFEGMPGESFDLIVTNPPYIATSENLMPEVAEHEPHQALYSGETGMEFYDRLASHAMNHLNDAGLLMMEVGYRQAASVRTMFESRSWRHIQTVKDLSGVERVVVVGWTLY